MPTSPKILTHAAIAIHSQLQKSQARPALAKLPQVAWQQCQQQLARWKKAHRRDWQFAARSYRQLLLRAVEDLQRQLKNLEQACVDVTPSPAMTARGIYHDLLALGKEFPEVCIQNKQIVVTTEPIEMEGLDLGSFDMELNVDSLPEARYAIKAREPNPAGSNSDVTHPHVQDEKLCEGEGRLAIRAALTEGRLLDFFMIVANTLATYNSESAFVSLADWEGVLCRDCNYSMGEDDRCHCNRCECDLCTECSSCCGDCGDYTCSECSTCCHDCEDYFCTSCLQSCTDCDNNFCERCLKNEQCKNCRKAEANKTSQPAPLHPAAIA